MSFLTNKSQEDFLAPNTAIIHFLEDLLCTERNIKLDLMFTNSAFLCFNVFVLTLALFSHI